MERHFDSSRLLVARQRRKLTKEKLAVKSGLTSRSIANYESGRNIPTSEALSKIAQVLGFPEEYFFGEPLNIPTAENASFRDFSRLTSVERYAALSAGGYAFALSAWIDEKYHLPELSVPDLEGVDPETAARLVRAEWGLGSFPIKNMVHLLESRGVRVFSLVEDSREVNAFVSWMGGATPFVFLNTVKSSESSRFDAAHELGHIVLHRHGDPKGKEVEAQANAFASAFLMPRTEMLALSGRCNNLPAVMKIKKHWNVSAMALIFRLHKVGVLTDWVYRSMCIELSAKGMRLREHDSDPRETSLILRKVLEDQKAKGVGLRDIASFVRIPVDELGKLIAGLTSVSLSHSNITAPSTPRVRGHLKVVG